MKLLTVVLGLLVISCGKSSSSNKQEEHYDPICGGKKSTLCMPSIEWNLETRALTLPKKISVKINDSFVADTCRSPESLKFSVTDAGKTRMTFVHHMLPRDFFTVEIKDLGDDCKSSVVYDRLEHPAYSVTTLTMEGREYKSVYVTLD